MKIFRATDIRINAIPIIADDISHANFMLLNAFYEGLQHFPGFSYAIGPWEPPTEMQPEALQRWAQEHSAGLAHFLDEGGWELHRVERLGAP